MPVTKSAAKRARQTIKRHKRNLVHKNAMKSDVKALLKAIAAGDAKVQDKLAKAQSSLDKAAKKNVIHKNKAARKKAQLAKAVKDGAARAKSGSKKATARTPVKPTENSEAKA
jgi:small subunit ribosomal protein S20